MILFSEAGTHLNVSLPDGAVLVATTVADLRARQVPEATILAGVQSWLKDAIDAEAERLRLLCITPGAGQAMEYQQAQVEAYDALAAADAGKAVDASAFPMLSATVGVDIDPQTGAKATDVLGVARSVKAAFTAWLAYGAAIKGGRVNGKAKVEAAATVADAVAVATAIAWPALP